MDNGNFFRRLAWIVCGLVLFWCPFMAAAQEVEEVPAKFRISGLGLLGNRLMKKSIYRFHSIKTPPSEFDANFAEDAVFVLFAQINAEGFLKPRLELEAVLATGATTNLVWSSAREAILPRPFQTVELRLRAIKGKRYFYESVEFDGSNWFTDEEARNYFYRSDFLLRTRRNRIYTPNGLANSVGNLKLALRRRGFQDAQTEVLSTNINDVTGAVAVRVRVREGLRHWVRGVGINVYDTQSVEPEVRILQLDQPYNQLWEQDFSQELRREEFRSGFPDVSVEAESETQEELNGIIYRDMVFNVVRGPLIRLGEVHFHGQERTREGFLHRRAALEGPLLNMLDVEAAREKLIRVGAFDSVQVRYEEQAEEAPVRDVIFDLEEGKRLDLSLLGGYGSYELLRGGFELDQNNIFGLGHRSGLRAMQSFKATYGSYTYAVPDLLTENSSLFVRGDLLRREEVSFDRREAGASVGLRKIFPEADHEVRAQYSYEVLDAEDAPVSNISNDRTVDVSSLKFGWRHDRQDNPLLPRAGYRLFGDLELATEALGGESDYQRLVVGASYRASVGGGRYIHLGLSHGVTLTIDSDRDDLPFNRRFFPGGENSVRGYQLGEASPVNELNEEIGAESYLQWNVEFEQSLTPTWSVVGLLDGVMTSADIDDYLSDDLLWSAGGGIRWNTVIGPVRLEYGHNLNPRGHDPSGTLHFSIGVPF